MKESTWFFVVALIVIPAMLLGFGAGDCHCHGSSCPSDCDCGWIDEKTGLHNGGWYDCNRNSVEDCVDIAVGASTDTNNDGIPDECQVLSHPQ